MSILNDLNLVEKAVLRKVWLVPAPSTQVLRRMKCEDLRGFPHSDRATLEAINALREKRYLTIDFSGKLMIPGDIRDRIKQETESNGEETDRQQ